MYQHLIEFFTITLLTSNTQKKITKLFWTLSLYQVNDHSCCLITGSMLYLCLYVGVVHNVIFIALLGVSGELSAERRA